jgi:hypothetical protein
MNIGDLHRADVPFRDDPNQVKNRIVLIVEDIVGTDEVVVVESRGKPHDRLTRIGNVDFEQAPYSGSRVSGTSHFYLQNLRVLKRSVIHPSPVGGLTHSDYQTFFTIIQKARQNFIASRSQPTRPPPPPPPPQQLPPQPTS